MKLIIRNMINRVEICYQREHIFRTGSITLIVGTWLTLFNQGVDILYSGLSPGLLPIVFLNYLTPFIVANWGLLSRVSLKD